MGKSRLFLLLFLLIVIGLGLSIFAVRQIDDGIRNTQLNVAADGLIYEVAAGKSLTSIAQDLYKLGIIKHPKIVVLYARVKTLTRIKKGEYRLSRDMSLLDLLELLNKGGVIEYGVTFLEGWTFNQVLDALHAEEKAQHLLRGRSSAEIIEVLALPIKHLEGRFFPDTYFYTAGTTDVEILRRAFLRMEAMLSEHWATRSKGLPYSSPYEALIMASIVEKETGQVKERPQIAGVFIERLSRKMRLQTDPTVIYGMGEKYKGNLTRKDLRTATPYNTYTIHGLPPTPIAMPSEGAIKASLNPLKTGHLYFVAKGDGSHYFSKTLAEHNQAVREYQIKNRKKDYRSAVQK